MSRGALRGGEVAKTGCCAIGAQDATGFITYTLVKVPTGNTALFFRVAGVDTDRNVLRLRLERYTLFW